MQLVVAVCDVKFSKIRRVVYMCEGRSGAKNDLFTGPLCLCPHACRRLLFVCWSVWATGSPPSYQLTRLGRAARDANERLTQVPIFHLVGSS